MTTWILLITMTATSPSGGGVATALTTVLMTTEADCVLAKATVDQSLRGALAVCLKTRNQ